MIPNEKKICGYRLIRSKRRTISIQVSTDGSVIIRAPVRASASVIESFIRSKQGWIQKSITEILNRNYHKIRLEPRGGGSLLFMGKIYPVIAVESDKDAGFDSHAFNIPIDPDSAQKSLIRILRAEAGRFLALRTDSLSRDTGIPYSRVNITGAVTRWGSCNAKGGLNFSYLLMLAPPEAIDYVVVHELAHVRHHNHSRKFWDLVASILPDYKERESALREIRNRYDISPYIPNKT